jgi:hypothetical protein
MCILWNGSYGGDGAKIHSLEYTTMNSLGHKNKLKEECFVKFMDKFKKMYHCCPEV